MSVHRLKVVLDRRGKGTVEIDGVDISASVEAIQISADSGSLPQINLQMSSDIDVEVVGDVKVVSDVVVAE